MQRLYCERHASLFSHEVAAVHRLGLDHANASVGEDVLLAARTDLHVLDRLVRLGVHPTAVDGVTCGHAAVVELDPFGPPGPVEAALDGELALRLSLPARASVAPGDHLAKAGDADRAVPGRGGAARAGPRSVR